MRAAVPAESALIGRMSRVFGASGRRASAEMLSYFENSYKQALQGLGIEQQGRRRRDEYRDGMIRLKLKSESPGP